MKNLKIYAIIAVAIVIIGLVISNIFLYSALKSERSKILIQKNTIETINNVVKSQAKTIEDLKELKTYSITLSPEVQTKIATTFGSSKEITLQYYFTMDGNSIKLNPDSVITIKK